MQPILKSTKFLSALLVVVMLIWGDAAHSAGAPRDPFNGRQSYSGSNMSCLIANDFYAVHFTAIREGQRNGQDSPFVKYCQEVPDVGTIHLTLDLLDRDVRSTPISLRVVEESGSDGRQPPEIKSTLFEVPAKVYRNGIVETKATINKPGHYALIALVGEDPYSEDDRLRIPFSVGLPSPTRPTEVFGKVVGGLTLLFFSIMAVIGYRTFRTYRPNIGQKTNAQPPGEADLSGQQSCKG